MGTIRRVERAVDTNIHRRQRPFAFDHLLNSSSSQDNESNLVAMGHILSLDVSVVQIS